MSEMKEIFNCAGAVVHEIGSNVASLSLDFKRAALLAGSAVVGGGGLIAAGVAVVMLPVSTPVAALAGVATIAASVGAAVGLFCKATQP